MSTTDHSLTERYGGPSRIRRSLVVGITVLLVGSGAAWLAWATAAYSDPTVASQAVGHDIVDDHTATVTARIEYGEDPVGVTCTARAIAHDKTVVGEVAFRPDPERPQITVEIATDRRATTVDWLGCTAAGQPRPR